MVKLVVLVFFSLGPLLIVGYCTNKFRSMLIIVEKSVKLQSVKVLRGNPCSKRYYSFVHSGIRQRKVY